MKEEDQQVAQALKQRIAEGNASLVVDFNYPGID